MKLKTWRQNNGIKATWLAEKLNVSEQRLYNAEGWEAGTRARGRIANEEIAKKLEELTDGAVQAAQWSKVTRDRRSVSDPS